MSTRGKPVENEAEHFGPADYDGWGPEPKAAPKPKTREAIMAELTAKLQRSRQREDYARRDLEAEPLDEFKRRHRGRIAKEQGIQSPLLADLATMRANRE